jgi:tetratricopeptide (TPR) repeat protein
MKLYAAACVLCLALLGAAYADFFHNAFHFDDIHVVENNLYLRSLANTARFFTDAQTGSSLPANAAYRPLVTLSLALDYHWSGGLGPVALLAAALVVFYRQVLDLCRPGPANRWLALFAATLFAVHTANSETLNLMHARSEILSTLGIVAGFLVWLASPRLRRLHLYLLPVALGALAKPPAVLFGPLLFILELLSRRWQAGEADRGKAAVHGAWGRALRHAARAAAPALAAGAVLYVFVDRMGASSLNYGGGDRFHYALTQVWVWVCYLRLFFLPRGLTADTDLGLIADPSDTRVFAGLLILGGLALVGWRSARSRRAWPVAFGLAWFALGLAPTSSFIPLAEPMNEHRIFLPFVGLILAAVWGARLGWETLAPASRSGWRRALPVTVCLLVLLAHAAGTQARNRTWKTRESLWQDVTVKSPGNGRAWMNYGVALMARGDFTTALACFERALALLPSYPTLQINLGIVHAAMGEPDKAEPFFQRALALDPGQPDSHYFYASWLAGNGRGPEALSHLAEALRLSPGFETARALRMDLLAASGDEAGAAALARETLVLAPDNARARIYATGGNPLAVGDAEARFQSGLRLAALGRPVDSALAYRAALDLDPRSSDKLNNLGWTLGKLGFFRQAVPYLEEAVRLRPDFTLARNNLAWVKSRLGDGP